MDSQFHLFKVRVSAKRKTNPIPGRAMTARSTLHNIDKNVLARTVEDAIALTRIELEEDYENVQVWQAVHAGRMDYIQPI